MLRSLLIGSVIWMLIFFTGCQFLCVFTKDMCGMGSVKSEVKK